MGMISWMVMGLLVGIVAKFIMPGDDPGGFIMTIILGVAGAFVGGFVSRFFGFGDFTGFNFGSFVIATVGAIILLIGYRMLKK
ncbi:MAG: GlsB/YeaQ/YmgE family stress response membrane protein [Desulfobulbaceae bacterium]|nr:GlsB/YeaQ/YmgE family stress response membrane protein [Desulfobulbaceae bacterium]